jgi:hypothetical protein
VRQIIMEKTYLIKLPLTLLLLAASLVVLSPACLIEALGLVNNFYATHGCPKAERIIKSAVATAIEQNNDNVPGLLRMFFSDCIVNVREEI